MVLGKPRLAEQTLVQPEEIKPVGLAPCVPRGQRAWVEAERDELLIDEADVVDGHRS
jgi:hypothetical protein